MVFFASCSSTKVTAPRGRSPVSLRPDEKVLRMGLVNDRQGAFARNMEREMVAMLKQWVIPFPPSMLRSECFQGNESEQKA